MRTRITYHAGGGGKTTERFNGKNERCWGTHYFADGNGCCYDPRTKIRVAVE